MTLASDVDAALRRLERAGGLCLAISDGGVTPALIRASQRRARALRAEAQRRVVNGALRALFNLPRALFSARPRFDRDAPVSTVG